MGRGGCWLGLSKGNRLLGAWKVMFLGIFFGLGACGQGESTSQSAPLPQDPFIQAYFNQTQVQSYREPYRTIDRPGDNLEAVLLEAINEAQTEILVAVQELRLPLVAEALVTQQGRGVRVRVVLENTYNWTVPELLEQPLNTDDDREESRREEWLAFVDLNGDGRLSPDELAQRDAIGILRSSRVPMVDDRADGSKGSGLMHHKFLVVDDRLVVTGSANFTPSGVHGDQLNPDSRGNTNHLLRLESPTLARLFREEFNLLWGDGPGGQPDSRFGSAKPARSPQTVSLDQTQVTLHFSPQRRDLPWESSSNGLIGQTLAQATQSADLALFVFSEQALADVLEERHRRGVTVRALIDSAFAFRDYSEGLDLLGVALGKNCTYEAGNRPWNPPITSVGVAQLPQGDKLHHKFGVVDQRWVITGSHNWSAAANYTNDETLLVIDSPTVAAHFHQEFERLYSTASLGLPPRLQDRVQADRQACGSP